MKKTYETTQKERNKQSDRKRNIVSEVVKHREHFKIKNI